MNGGKRYKVLIVEDEAKYSGALQVSIAKSENFSVLAVTDSEEKAYKYIQTGLPDVVIVDLELSEGDGVSLLKRIRDTERQLDVKPYLLVITSYGNNRVMEKVKDELADFVLRKHNLSFSPKTVLDHLDMMSNLFDCNRNPEIAQIDSSLEKEELIRARINRELDRYYISHGSSAKDYLAEAIYEILRHSKSNQIKIGKIFTVVGIKFGKEPQAVDKAIRRLLHNAFLKTDPEDIEKVYAPYIDIERGVPTNKEFILYVANKIRDERIY